MNKPILTIAVTGGAGQLAYQLLFRLASGEVFGLEQRIALKILEIPSALTLLEGVKMELQDCAFPLLHSIEVTSDPYQAFLGADYALLIGAKPRGPGMERGDLLKDNGKIFVQQGQALNEAAKTDAKVFVVGNPCNTNCLIAMSHAPRLSRKNFYAMTRLDQNRAAFLLADKGQIPVGEVSHLAIWGNHSATQVPDYYHARMRGQKVEAFIKDPRWFEQFIELVRNRGAEIIKARGKSSAASAAQALINAIQDTLQATKEDNWFSSGIATEGNGYGIAENLIYSFPCKVDKTGNSAAVSGLDIPDFLANQLKATERELLEERDFIKNLIKG